MANALPPCTSLPPQIDDVRQLNACWDLIEEAVWPKLQFLGYRNEQHMALILSLFYLRLRSLLRRDQRIPPKPGNLIGFLIRVLTYAAKTARTIESWKPRSTRFPLRDDVTDPWDPMEETDPRAEDPAIVVERMDHAAQVRKCVDELPPQQRVAITAVYFEDLTHTAAAQAMKVDRSSVSHYIRIAVESIGRCMGVA